MASLLAESNNASVPREELINLRNQLLALGGNASEHSQPVDNHESVTIEPSNLTLNAPPSSTAMDDAATTNEGPHFAGGDTQPMESQIYRDYSRIEENDYTYDTTTESQRLGQTGDMNLMDDWPENLPGYETQDQTGDNEDYADLLETQQTGEIAKFPETPAVAGQKHARNGDVLTSATTAKTPASQLFGGKVKEMTATQMFAFTQEPSSPFAGDVVSDPISSRPSPNIEQPFSASSPQLGTPKAKQPAFHKTFPEPRSDYRPIQFSPKPASDSSSDDSDDDMHIPRPRSSRSNASIRKELSSVRANSRQARDSDHIDLTKSTPATVRKSQHDFDLLDSDGEEEEVIVNEEEDYIAAPNEDDDVYDEHSQTVIKSSGLDDDVEMPGDEEANVEPQVENSSLQEHAVPNSQVADSQPAVNTVDSATQATSTSLILGTQCQNATSQPAITVDHTVEPPPSSPPLPGEEAPQKLHESNTAPFSTANTHISAKQSPAKLLTTSSQLVSQQSMTPRKRAQVSHFADIEAGNAVEEAGGATQENMTDVMGELIPDEDHQIFEILAPSSKRRRITYESRRQVAKSKKSVPTKAASEEETVLRESPSKANELPEPPTAVTEETQPSAKKRERAGAQAVSQLVAGREKKPAKKKARKRNLRKSAQSIATPAPTDDVVEDTTTDLNEPTTMLQVEETVLDVAADAIMEDEPNPAENSDAADVDAVVAPERVIAYYGLNYPKYFAATWLNTDLKTDTHKVRFDDGRIADVRTHQVMSLDPRVGDVIKLETGQPTLKNKPLIICGFGPVVQTEKEKALGTDSRGRLLAKVELKAGAKGVFDVLINQIKLDHGRFKDFLDRPFTPPVRQKRSRAQTPVSAVAISRANTPVSRSRRASSKWLPHLRAESTDTLQTTPTGVFVGMAFAFSGLHDATRLTLTRRITQNGGLVLKEGLSELFDVPSLESGQHIPKLVLKTEYENLGFVALLADDHSRRAKYIEALALGLPALSTRFITDSLKEQSVSPTCHKYLLAAGQSAYLDGATRSRQLANYSTSGLTLAETIANRPTYLEEADGVIVVAPKKNEKYWQGRVPAVFLTQALGPSRAKRVRDLAEAAEAIKEEPDQWNWVFDEGPASEVAQLLSAPKSKKRKRDKMEESDPKKPDSKDDSKKRDYLSTLGEIRVVNDEFVIQSLILGTLVG